uniref:lysosomal alpha-glucosidase n=1 Tax=Lonchura striata TaxID=40157 RepID=UPI0012937246|nr:lysosomal alpha-glucosidase [Lonchura striata domestica]
MTTTNSGKGLEGQADPFVTKDEEPGTYRPYDLGQEMGVWVNNSDGVTPALGRIWPPGYSVFPDFTNPRAVEWWTTLCLEFKDVLDYDGIWIDMNEPANFMRGQLPGCADTEINNPPYTPRSVIMQADRLFVEKYLQNVVQQATGKRAFVLARSTFVGSGKHGGHWLGDNFSLWKDLHRSIIGILEFNLFGIPYIGADICGFNYNTTYELCLRWMQLGSFYPFSRNHNSEGNIVTPDYHEALCFIWRPNRDPEDSDEFPNCTYGDGELSRNRVKRCDRRHRSQITIIATGIGMPEHLRFQTPNRAGRNGRKVSRSLALNQETPEHTMENSAIHT